MVIHANTNCCAHLSCISWEDATFQGTGRQRQVNVVLGNVVRLRPKTPGYDQFPLVAYGWGAIHLIQGNNPTSTG
jgi:hypothetical protein